MIKGTQMNQQVKHNGKTYDVRRYIVLSVTGNLASPDAADNSGRTLGDLKISGFMVCPILGDRADGFIVRTADRRTKVSIDVTDEVLAEAVGFTRAMEALAQVYDCPVIVEADLGVSGGKVADVVGTYGAQFAQFASNQTAPVAPVAEVHGFGRDAMLCGEPMVKGTPGTLTAALITCEACKVKAYAVRTADGVEITDDLAVYDYDLKVGRVRLASLSSEGWFDVVRPDGGRSYMNGVRVATTHLGQAAEAVLTPASNQTAPVAEGDTVYRDRDGAQGTIVGVGNGLLAVSLTSGMSMSRTLAELEADGYEVIPAAEVKAGQAAAWGSAERVIWDGTGTGLARPFRTRAGKRKASLSRRARHSVKAGN